MEASCGDAEKVQRRLWEIRDFSVLDIDATTQELAAVPEKCPEDAVHIAVAAAHDIENLSSLGTSSTSTIRS